MSKIVTKREALNGKPYAGNPHVRFDEGEAASTAMSRRGSLLYESKYHRMRFYSGFLFIILAISIVDSVYASKCNDGADCVKVSSFGFDSSDSTEFVQRALDSGARKVILDDCGTAIVVR